MSFANLATTDTFRTWFNTTNQLIDFLNNRVVGDGMTAYGVFTIGANANTSLAVSNNFFVNTSLLLLAANTTLAANVTFTPNANVVNMAAGQFLIQPVNGTLVNSAITVNATALFLASITANADMTVNSTLTVVGNTTTSAITANGLVLTRQTAFSGANSVLAPAALTNPEYDDYNPTGLSDAQVLNLSPSLNVVLTGIAAPTTVGATGARLIFLQNLDSTFKVTLASANLNSGANNRFITPSNINIDIVPGAAVALIWTTTNRQWRVLNPNFPNFAGLVVSGNASFANVTVSALSTFSGNATFGSTTLFVDTTNNRVGINNPAPSVPLSVNGNSSLVGTLVVSGNATLQATLTTTANASLSSGALVLRSDTLNLTLANTLFANTINESYIRKIRHDQLTIDSSASIAALTVSGATTLQSLSATTASFSSTLSVTGVATLSANLTVSGSTTSLQGITATSLQCPNHSYSGDLSISSLGGNVSIAAASVNFNGATQVKFTGTTVLFGTSQFNQGIFSLFDSGFGLSHYLESSHLNLTDTTKSYILLPTISSYLGLPSAGTNGLSSLGSVVMTQSSPGGGGPALFIYPGNGHIYYIPATVYV